MPELLLATTSHGKIAEIRDALAGLGLRLLGLQDLEPVEPPEETGTTFEENALLKARYYAARLGRGRMVLADDSGLEIDAWGGAPGVHSARYLGAETPYSERHRVILDRLAAEPNRRARFVCAAALIGSGGTEILVRGTVEGAIAPEARGVEGFGYDPIFLLPELGKTFGEIPSAAKGALSHRGRALAQLRERLAAGAGLV